jgi:hypothetical protein
MPIIRLLKDHAFEPDEIAIMVRAFEGALGDLGLVDREDPATLIVAKRIVELAKQGERDVGRLRAAALDASHR